MQKTPKGPEQSEEHVIYPSALPPLPPMTEEERRLLEVRSAVIHDKTGLENEIANAGHRLTGEIGHQQPEAESLPELGRSIIQSMAEIDLVYNPESKKDAYAYQLQLGLKVVAGLGNTSGGDIEAYIDRYVQGLASSGQDFTRRQSFRVSEGIEMLEHAYDGAYDTGDENEHWERFRRFVYEHCPSKAWENDVVLNHFLDAVRDSYKSLQMMFGLKHVDVASALEGLRVGFLRAAGLSSQPSDTELQNMRVLAWSNWPDNDSGPALHKADNS